jgi:hypothetical protein
LPGSSHICRSSACTILACFSLSWHLLLWGSFCSLDKCPQVICVKGLVPSLCAIKRW